MNVVLQGVDASVVLSHEMTASQLRAAQQSAAQSVGLSVHFSDTLHAIGCKGPEMAVIPTGWFEIGSPVGEVGHDLSESPQCYVQVTRAYAIGRFTITAEEWAEFAGATDFRPERELIWSKGREPVVNVRTADILRYIAWLNTQTGQLYRLPTEAEWEYAARAGTQTAFNMGDMATCKEVLFKSNLPMPDETQKKWFFFPKCAAMRWAMEVGSKPANVWGLHDVHGNVWEITSTPWLPDHAKMPRDAHQNQPAGKNQRIVIKGGSWFDPAAAARSAARWSRLRDELDVNMGFRLVREL